MHFIGDFKQDCILFSSCMEGQDEDKKEKGGGLRERVWYNDRKGEGNVEEGWIQFQQDRGKGVSLRVVEESEKWKKTERFINAVDGYGPLGDSQ